MQTLSLFIYLLFICIYTCTHVHSSDFAKLAIPQVEILGMVGLLAFVSTPDHHPGGSVCTWLFCRHDKVFPWIRDQRRNQIRQHLQSSRASPAVFIKFCTWIETYKEEKVDIQKLHEIPVPTHPRSMNLKTRTRRYGKNIGRCAFWNLGKFVGTDCSVGMKFT